MALMDLTLVLFHFNKVISKSFETILADDSVFILVLMQCYLVCKMVVSACVTGS